MKKKVLAVFLTAVLLFGILPVSTFTVQGVTLSGPYSSDPATYIVNIALAQEGKTRYDLGYGDNWCAAFVSDCAAAAGQSAAVPWRSGVSDLESALIKAGATKVSTPRAGDIAILNGGGHCGICVDSKWLIDGNNVGGGNYPSHPEGYVQKSQYSWFYTNTYYRPNYNGHTHSYSAFVGYSDSHPHNAIYKCSCGATTTKSETTFKESCIDCQISQKPALTIWPGTSAEDTFFRSTYVGPGNDYDYRIYNSDTGDLVVYAYSQRVLYAVNLAPGNYYATVTASNGYLHQNGASKWWKSSDTYSFSVTVGLDAPVKTMTYNGNTYELYLNRLSWEHAKAKCEEKGGHLAVITSAEEQQAIYEEIGKHYLFLGATDEEEEGVWKWITGEPFDYAPWFEQTNYSSHEGYREENYLAFRSDNTGWNSCVDKNMYIHGFICEYEGHTHEYTSAVTTAATCTKNGVMTYTCSCGDSYTEVIPAHHIEQIIQSVNATCTEGGYDLVKCTECGVRYKINETPALEHHHIFDHTVDPTCEEKGYDVYKCERCDDCYYDNYKDAIGHDYHQTRTVAATCVKDGYYIYTCAHCTGTSHTAIPALGHYFVSGFCVDCGVSEADAPFELSGDGRVDANDLTVLKEALLGDKIGALFDVNGDGETDVRDLVRMKKHFAK